MSKNLKVDSRPTNHFPIAESTEEMTDCAVCLSKSSIFLFTNHDRLYEMDGIFGLRQCLECSLVWLSPRPTRSEIAKFYPEEDYYSYITTVGSIDDVTTRSILGSLRDHIRRVVLYSMGYQTGDLHPFLLLIKNVLIRIFGRQATYGFGDKFPKAVTNGHALDVGSGNGRFLTYLKRHGWSVSGIDLNESASKVAKAHFEIDVQVTTFEDAILEAESFDFISLSHVLEHTYDPSLTIRLVKKYLRKDGTAYIEVPNYDSFSRKRSGVFWYPWETPRHLYAFSPSVLKLLIERSGMHVEKMRTENGNFWAWDRTYRLEEKLGGRFRTRPLNRLRDKPEILLMRILSWINHRFYPMSGDFICCWVHKQT